MNCSYLRERWGKRKEERRKGEETKKVIERILMAIVRIEEGAGKEKGNFGKQHLVKGARVRLCIVQKEKGLTTRRFLIRTAVYMRRRSATGDEHQWTVQRGGCAGH